MNFQNDPEFMKFLDAWHHSSKMWIYKPGGFTNRGNGIRVFNDLKKILSHIYLEIKALEADPT